MIAESKEITNPSTIKSEDIKSQSNFIMLLTIEYFVPLMNIT